MRALGAICLILSVCAACGRAPEVRPMLPRRAEPPPDVDRLLAALDRPAAPGVVEAIAEARRGVDPKAPGAAWLPSDWSKPRFVWFGGYAKNLDPVRAICAGLRDEALPGDAQIPCPALDAAIATADDRIAALARLPQPLDEATRATLKSKILEQGAAKAIDPTAKALRPETIDALLGVGHGRVRTAQDVEAWRAALDVRDAALAEVELAAWRVLLAYGLAVRGRHAPAHYTRITEQNTWADGLAKRSAKRRGARFTPRVHPPDWPSSAETAVDAAMRRVARLIGTRPADEVIADVRPRGAQYAQLIAARARYRAIVEGGGFVKVPDLGRVKRTGSHKQIPALRARLAQEGYAPAPADPKRPQVFDNPLAQALIDYQQAHMERPKAQVDRRTRQLFAISASEKLARIDAALEAWRQALPRPDYFVQVNIPDYHVEVWKAGKRLDRIRVVVGNAKRERKEGKLVRPNATPVMHAEIQHIVYNPYWNIPQRILEEEVIDEALREEDNAAQVAWLEDQGYEVVRPGTRWQMVRQLPGPKNPLGQVKILFPNAHDVYLHDTPAKALFQNPVRAYSHGCMRVHQPLRLAQTLLEQDGQFDADNVRRWLKQDEPETVTLRNRVPIYVEYIPVRVDEGARTWFLRDVYKQFEVHTAEN